MSAVEEVVDELCGLFRALEGREVTRPGKGPELTMRQRAGERVRGASERSEVMVAGDDEDGRLDHRRVAGLVLDGEVLPVGLELEGAPLHRRYQLPYCGTRLWATPGVDVQGRRSREVAPLEELLLAGPEGLQLVIGLEQCTGRADQQQPIDPVRKAAGEFLGDQAPERRPHHRRA